MQNDSSIDQIRENAHLVRTETVRLISIAKTGHYASTFSCAEILAALYSGVLTLKRGVPDWPSRDRLLLGKGHAAVGVYPLLAKWDFLDPDVLDQYARLGNPLGDHPDMRLVPGIDFSSGSLGHALSVGVGMALAARIQELQYHVFVLLGDGELHEGQVWEAAMAGADKSLGHLIAIVDRNEYSLDGRVDDVLRIEPLADKWRAFGWTVAEVDGHDPEALLGALLAAKSLPEHHSPTVIIAHTVKGKGVAYMESEPGWHLGYLAGPDEEAALRELNGIPS